MLLKRIIKRTFIYKFFAKNKLKFANSNILITLEAYPRSGQTFLKFFLENYTKKISSHTHCIYNLKLSKNKNIKTLIIIRNPVDSISSFINYRKIITNKSFSIESAINDWLDFYNYVKLNFNNNFLILNFDDLILNDFKYYCNILNFLNIKPLRVTKNLKKTLKRINNKKINKRLFSLKYKYERDSNKTKIKNTIKKNKKYKELIKLFQYFINGKVLNNHTNI